MWPEQNTSTPVGCYQPPYCNAGVGCLRAVQAVVDIDDMRPWLNLERCACCFCNSAWVLCADSCMSTPYSFMG